MLSADLLFSTLKRGAHTAMELIDLRNQRYKVNLAQYIVKPQSLKGKSSYHVRAYSLIHLIFPADIILQEIPTGDGYIDLFLPNRLIAVECQGEQHSTYSAHFHKTKLGFMKAKGRDRKKVEWAEVNGIRLICLNYNETDEQWKDKILDEAD